MDLFIKHRHQAYFSEVYNRHFLSLCKYVSWLGADIAQGKDIAQIALLKVYQNPELFDPSKKLKVWLCTIAKNLWKNELRRVAIRSKHNHLKWYENGLENEDPPELNKRFREVIKSIQNLSEKHKEVFIMKYSNGLTINEISLVCNCSEGTVKSRLFYALQQLRKEINIQERIKI